MKYQIFLTKLAKMNHKNRRYHTKLVSLTTYHWEDCSSTLVEVQIGTNFLESVLVVYIGSL